MGVGLQTGSPERLHPCRRRISTRLWEPGGGRFAPMTGAHLLQAWWTRHVGREQTSRGVLPPLLAPSFRSPPVAPGAPPVRRRRSSGGVRVIQVPHSSMGLCVPRQACVRANGVAAFARVMRLEITSVSQHSQLASESEPLRGGVCMVDFLRCLTSLEGSVALPGASFQRAWGGLDRCAGR